MSDAVRRDLLSYYDDEARSRRRRPVSGHRVDLRDRFAELLAHEGRRSVLDVGAGPASDASGFVDVVADYCGVDLSPENAALGTAAGFRVIAASLFDLPFRAATFDAGWSMSTMMHVPDAEAEVAFRELARALEAGSPLAVGQWGGTLGEFVSSRDADGSADADGSERRLFSLRTWDRNRELLESIGDIEHHEVWSAGPEGWDYHYAVVRIT